MITTDYTEKKAIDNRTRILPNAHFLTLYGDTVCLYDFNRDLPLVIIYFHPDCHFCRLEGMESGLHADSFTNAQLVFITYDDSLQRVEKFCFENHLFEIKNLEILQDTWNQVDAIFGRLAVPTILIYDKDRRLKKKFSGETKPEAIISGIREPTI
jgi:thiol-disulfide isomerase/thioredoxin